MKVVKGNKGNTPLVFERPEPGAPIIRVLQPDEIVTVHAAPAVTLPGQGSYFQVISLFSSQPGYVYCGSRPGACGLEPDSTMSLSKNTTPSSKKKLMKKKDR